MKKLVMVIACLLLLASAGAVGLSCSDDAEEVVANFIGAPNYGSPPLEVQFADQSTGEIDQWTWDFGDGETSTAQNPTHTYTAIGEYTVKLTVSGPDGSDTETKADYIQVGNIIARFTASTTSGFYPLSVQFTDESTGDVAGWAWDFGNGETSTEQNPSTTYESEGVYTVILEVTGPAGTDTEVKTGYINVEPEWYEKEVTWRLATYSLEGTLQTDYLQALADLIEEKSRGRIEVKVFAGGSLYQLDQMFDAVTTGAVDLGYTGVTYYFGKMPKTASSVVYSNFVAADTYEQTVQNMALSKEFPMIVEEFAANDITTLLYGPVGSADLFFTSPVTVMEDIAGMKLACSGGTSPLTQSLGATPVPMDLTDFYLSCQTGLVEGWVMCPLENYVNMQLYEVAPYLVYGDFMMGNLLLMSQSSFDALPEELQEAVMEAGAEIQAEWLDAIVASDQGYLQQMEDNNEVTVYHLPAAEKARWVNTAFMPFTMAVMANFMSEDEIADVIDFIDQVQTEYRAGS